MKMDVYEIDVMSTQLIIIHWFDVLCHFVVTTAILNFFSC